MTCESGGMQIPSINYTWRVKYEGAREGKFIAPG